MPTLILMVQNSVPFHELGSATSSSNYFRQIGGSLGASLVGTLLASQLADKIPQYVPAAALNALAQSGHPLDTNSLTPTLVHDALPAVIGNGIVKAYNDVLPPIFLYLVPIIGVAFVLSFFLKQIPLRTASPAAGQPAGGSTRRRGRPAGRRRTGRCRGRWGAAERAAQRPAAGRTATGGRGGRE
ncbi:MFS transporter [Fodinicola feengrottensis]|uniref:hypothetical protein n=1 Tax=Fodinicola feengrottensis TaxID=435914 RepID=UPI0024427230|nr:hypothetical protein [Fodinicola feengrottensis]